MAFGLLIAILMGYAYLRIMRIPEAVKYVVWISVWGTLIALSCTSYFFYKEYEAVR